MKYINELREGENVIEHYLCKSRQSMKSRNGKTYLSLKLQDKTGIVDAKVWDMNKDIQSFQENDFISNQVYSSKPGESGNVQKTGGIRLQQLC